MYGVLCMIATSNALNKVFTFLPHLINVIARKYLLCSYELQFQHQIRLYYVACVFLFMASKLLYNVE